MTEIIKERIRGPVEETLGDDQYGFRKGKGTREAILTLRMILDKRMAKGKRTYIAYLDLEKAFDKVKWNKLFRILKRIGIRYRDRRLIHMLYRNEKVVIQWKGEESEAKIRNGVRQGCSLSPMLFNVYVEDALMEVRRRMEVGISIQGEMIDMLRFADDIAVLAESREELENFLNVMEEVMRVDYEMKLN